MTQKYQEGLVQIMSINVTLEPYICQAEMLLKETGNYHTKVDNQALKDMIIQAKKAMEGKNLPPHSNCRQFIEKQDREMQMQFAKKRYTMAPSYLEGKVWSYYGLEEAIEWFKSRDMRKEKYVTQEERKDAILLQCDELLKTAKIGDEIGSYPIYYLEKLRNTVTDLKRNWRIRAEEPNARLLVKCQNVLYKTMCARVYCCDKDEEDLLFISKQQLEDLKTACYREGSVKKQYQNILNIADEMSLEEVKKRYKYLFEQVDYKELNQNYKLWERTASNYNFSVPKATQYGVLQFILPHTENEQQGLGHIWIDDVEISASSGNFDFPKNGGFEQAETGIEKPCYWKPIILKGNPKLYRENKEPFCGREKYSIYIENVNSDDEGMWEYEEKIPFQAGEMYTLNFSAKVDGKFKEGLKACIQFYDNTDQLTGEFCLSFNRKAWVSCKNYNLRMQCDAIVYAITGQRSYAEKSKYEILHLMDDFIQGAEYWMRENARPEGSDAYGAVQGGRNLCSIAVSYALIRRANLFTKKEKERFFQMIDYFLRYMMDKRDRSMLTMQEAQYGCSNWQLDMCIGTVMIMMAVPDYPKKNIWILNGYRVVKAQLLCNVNPDGSWPESLRYHHAALERLGQFARVVQRQMGEDWFAQKWLKSMFYYSLSMQTPGYTYFDGHIATPPFGDHALSGGNEYACHGLYCKQIEQTDKNLADQMYITWCKAGKPMKRLWGESVVLENLLYVGEDYQVSKGFERSLHSEARFPDSGIYLFRNGKEKENFCAIMASPKPIGHGHLDQGSFMIYKDNIPVIMDSGIEGYFDSSTQWHISSYSHAVMQFADLSPVEEESNTINLSAGMYSRKRGWADVPKQSKVLKCDMGEEEEFIIMEIQHTKGKQIRTIYHHIKSDIYIIKDRVEGFTGEILFNLPTVMKKNKITGQQINGTGYYDVDLQVVFVGKIKDIWEDKGRSTAFFPYEGNLPMLSYIRARAEAQDGFMAVISAQNTGEKKRIKEISQLNENLYIGLENGNKIRIQVPNCL